MLGVRGLMLDLKSPRWSEFTHAYGKAADIPDLLVRLRTAPPQENYTSEPWYSIWSALCHQGDVYTATYAAMPHLVGMAAEREGKDIFEYLNFIGYAEACRHHTRSPAIPEDLENDYWAAIDASAELFLKGLGLQCDQEELKVMLGGYAAVKSYPKLGDVIINLDSGLLCPECERDLSCGLFAPDTNVNLGKKT